MPRELRPQLEALIASRHCSWQTTMDIILTSGLPLFFSSSDIFVDNFGKTQQYTAKLRQDSVGALSLSQDIEADMMEFGIDNLDKIFGQLFTGAVREFDGAQAIVGTLFVDPQNPDFELGEHYWDPKMPGDLVSSEIKDLKVDLTLTSTIDSTIIPGRTIASEFQWREPIGHIPVSDPNDNPTGRGFTVTPPPGGCFVAGTRVRVPGGFVSIELMKEGDSILVWDFIYKKLVDSIVTKTEIHLNKPVRKIATLQGRRIEVTDEQPLYIGKGSLFRRVDEAVHCYSPLGVVDENGIMKMDRVISAIDHQPTTVHHLHVDHKDHNYVLENGIIAHNLKDAPGGRYGDIDDLFPPTSPITTYES